MSDLYKILEENPNLKEELSKSDIAAANYLFEMSDSLVNTELKEEDDYAWVHTNSKYNETVAKIIESHPKAVKLILGLSKGYGLFTGGTPSQFAYLLVNDYLKDNLEHDYSRSY